jgi:lipopolysaccharide export system protein LptA
VESLSFSRNLTKIKTVGVAVLLLFFGMTVPAAVRGDQKPITADKTRESQKIHITSDRLESQPKSNLVEFIGNVRVRQGNTTISSDRLKIYYQGGMDGKRSTKGKTKGKKGGQESIKKIVAQGNVIIKIDDRIAVADRAQYSPGTGEIILTGKNAKISEGANFVSGEKITFNRNSNRITVQRSGNKRVEAVFFSETVSPGGITGGDKTKKQ